MLEKCNTGNMADVSRNDPQVNVRMPATLKARLEDAAKASGRTLTGEVVRRLEDSLNSASDPIKALSDRVSELERLLQVKKGRK